MLVSGLAGAAGALLRRARTTTVGASGALFGILGAAFVFERQNNYVLGGGALTIIVLNLAFTFAIPGSHWGTPWRARRRRSCALALCARQRTRGVRPPRAPRYRRGRRRGNRQRCGLFWAVAGYL